MHIVKKFLVFAIAGILSISAGLVIMASNISENSDMQIGGSMGGKTLYLVESEDQLRSIGTGKYGLDQAYMMSQNIELTKEWIPIGTKEAPFTGIFWGNGCEIKNLKMTNPDATIIGLFGYAKEASIYNVIFLDMDIASAGINVDNKFVNAACAVAEYCEIYDISIK